MRLKLPQNKNLLYVLAICFVATGTPALQTELGANQRVTKEHNLLLDSIKLDNFSSDGDLTYVLEAFALKQNSSTGTSHLDQPTIEFENPEGTLWKVKARWGKLYKSQIGVVLPNDLIHLGGNVRIIRLSLSDQRLEINSEHFFLFPSKNYGETMSSVTITSQNAITTAAKLSVNLKLGEIKLESSPVQNVETKILYLQTEK